jgi:glycosyltransferase involved in cell wall biosynthesis
MRHVLMTADTIGGVWSYTMELCAALARYGVQVTLMSMGRLPSEDEIAEVRRIGNIDLRPTAWRTEWMSGCAADLEQSGTEFSDLAEAVQPDVIHLNNYWHARLDLPAPVIVAAHSCVATWWKACRETPLPDEWLPYLGWVQEAVAQADMLVAPTAAFLAEFEAAHGQAVESLVIPNGRSAMQYKPGVKRRIVFTAGRLWDDAKNIALLGRVADTIDTPIIAAGDLTGPDGAELKPGGLATLGRLTPAETKRWMAEAAIFASPARYEPFGLSVLEAALSGCALILGDIPTHRELWDGVATFVEPDDAAGLKRAIRMLTDMPELAASDGRKARERAVAYSADAMGEAYMRLYRTFDLKVAA